MKYISILKQPLILTLCLSWQSMVFAQLNPAVTPGQNFDLSEWKLNYPMYNTEEENLTSFTNDYFYSDSTTGGMVFKCPNITEETGGSSYPRCELRELLNKGASASDKSNNWTLSTNTTRDDYGGYNGVLSATLRVDRVSTTSDQDYQLGRVIVGQIHGDDNEPCRVYYRLLPGHTKGSVYFAHEQSKAWGDNKEEFWHELIGTRSTTGAEPANGIALGEVWSYTIDVQDESMTVSVYDSLKNEIASKTISSSMTGDDNFDATYANADNYLYFKAGVYNQNNGGDTTDYVQATFFALSNTHGPDSTSGNLSVSPNSLNFTAAGGSQDLTITSDTSWTAVASESWISLSESAGDGNASLTVSTDENDESTEREGSITITNALGNLSKITVSQAQASTPGQDQGLPITSAVASIENTDKGEIAANVLDNDVTTIWAGDGTDGDPTLDLNLDTTYMVSSIEIGFAKQDERETYFSVQYWDETQYVDVLTDQTQAIVDASQATDLFKFEFPLAVPSNKIRVIGQGNSASEWNSYTEVNLYGWDITDSSGVSVNANENNLTKFFPNPSEGTLVIENSLGAQMQVFNIAGTLVFTRKINSDYETIATGLRQGIYLLVVNKGNEAPYTEKLIVK